MHKHAPSFKYIFPKFFHEIQFLAFFRKIVKKIRFIKNKTVIFFLSQMFIAFLVIDNGLNAPSIFVFMIYLLSVFTDLFSSLKMKVDPMQAQSSSGSVFYIEFEN